jgi:signal transduction histidine kinase
VVFALPWPALGSIASGLIAVGFLGYLWPHRKQPGATLFMAMIGAVILWTVSYGVALVTFEPTLRFLLEIPIWLGTTFTSLLFFAFALEYTGRKDAVRSLPMLGGVGLMLGFVALIATNPQHNLVWQNYRIEPSFGVATVAYTTEAWLLLIMLVLMLLTAGAILVLVDTFASYGPLYRYQTLAVAISPLPVIPGILLWLFQVGPAPYLNLAPLLFPLHLALDMYAFFRRNMFELTPADRRAGDRTAIDDLGIGVLIVDDEQRIINANETAAGIFGRSKRALLGSPLGRIDDDIALAVADQRLTRGEGAGRREYAVTASPITDSADTAVGHTVTLQDITAERQREQRLAVLNRVLRHNLRNDLNVATGYLDIVREQTENDEHRRMLETAARNTASVITLGEKARTVERTLEGDSRGEESIELAALLDALVAELLESHDGHVDTDVPAALTVRCDRQLLESVCGNLVENALEHGGREPRVGVEARATDGTLRLVISDTGPGIPEHELRVIEQGEETDLEHGSGIGLWLVEWGATALGGTVSYETGETGTTATVTIPGVVLDGGEAETGPG